MSHLTPEEQQLQEYRRSTNFRSVTRSDPSVQEIIETSTYSTIYHYDEIKDAWEKQKQEGPLFIVRRDKAPEYALFMLNRQAIKNVFLPLVPGEMKLTVTDESTLQVARRGEKTRRGIWFSEGRDGVDRFREGILRICGEPSKKPDTPALAGSSTSPVPAVPLPVGDDGLTRLFAGLMQAPTSVPNQMTTKTTTITTSQTTAPVPIPMPVEPVLPPLPNVPPTESRPIDNGASLAMTSGQSDVPSMLEPAPPAPFKPVHPPGQTVGDLLNSILGVASPPLPAGPPPMIPPHSSMSRNDDRRSPLPNPDRPAPPTSAGTPRSPFPPVISPNVPPQLAPHPAANFLPPLPGSSPAVPNTSHIVSPPHHQASPVPPISYPSQPLDPRLAVAASLVDTVPSKDYTSHAQGPVDPKFAFVRDLIELLHTDGHFVDELWRAYQARSSGRRQG